MSDLSKAADDLDRLEELEPKSGRVGLANRLRRRNGLMSAIERSRLSDALRFAHITDSDGDYLLLVAKQVYAALDITEATLTDREWTDFKDGTGYTEDTDETS